MVLIDTSAWIVFFRKDGDLLTKLGVKGLLDAYEGGLCGAVEMEFFGGMRGKEAAQLLPFFDLIPYIKNDQKIWRRSAWNFARLKAAGFTLPWNDVLIATIALENQVATYALDKHFETMAEYLDLRLNEPGYNGQWNPDFA